MTETSRPKMASLRWQSSQIGEQTRFELPSLLGDAVITWLYDIIFTEEGRFLSFTAASHHSRRGDSQFLLNRSTCPS